jgi:hypothetical protein
MTARQIILNQLRLELPPVFTRRTICKMLGGLLSPGTLANLDCSGEGPKGVRVGKAVLYERENFLGWLQKRMSREVSNGKTKTR